MICIPLAKASKKSLGRLEDMNFTFPLLTIRKKREYSFRDAFWELIERPTASLYVISPFIDSDIFVKIFKKTLTVDMKKELVLITRPPGNDVRRQDFEAIHRALDNNRSRYRLESLNDVRWYFDPYLHAKALVCDFKQILFGSQNFTHNGMGDDLVTQCNNELGALIEDADAVTEAKVRQFVASIIAGSTTVYPQ